MCINLTTNHNEPVKWNSAQKNTHTDLYFSLQTPQSCCLIIWTGGVCWLPSIYFKWLLIQVQHRRRSWVLCQRHVKMVKITHGLPMIKKGLAGTTFKHQ